MIPTLYDARVLDQIRTVAEHTPFTAYQVFYHPDATPPPLKVANVTLTTDPVIPVGRVLVMAVRDVPDTDSLEDVMQYPTALSWNGDGALVVEYVDDELSVEGGPRLHTALEIPNTEDWADDIEQLRAHAGILVGEALRALQRAAMEES